MDNNRNRNIDNRYGRSADDTSYSRYLILGGLLVLALIIGALVYNNYRGEADDAAGLSPAAGYGTTTGTYSDFSDRDTVEGDTTGTGSSMNQDDTTGSMIDD